jgi:hypothetical protein
MHSTLQAAIHQAPLPSAPTIAGDLLHAANHITSPAVSPSPSIAHDHPSLAPHRFNPAFQTQVVQRLEAQGVPFGRWQHWIHAPRHCLCCCCCFCFLLACCCSFLLACLLLVAACCCSFLLVLLAAAAACCSCGFCCSSRQKQQKLACLLAAAAAASFACLLVCLLLLLLLPSFCC